MMMMMMLMMMVVEESEENRRRMTSLSPFHHNSLFSHPTPAQGPAALHGDSCLFLPSFHFHTFTFFHVPAVGLKVINKLLV